MFRLCTSSVSSCSANVQICSRNSAGNCGNKWKILSFGFLVKVDMTFFSGKVLLQVLIMALRACKGRAGIVVYVVYCLEAIILMHNMRCVHQDYCGLPKYDPSQLIGGGCVQSWMPESCGVHGVQQAQTGRRAESFLAFDRGKVLVTPIERDVQSGTDILWTHSKA